jgi:hypothetical protein
MLKPLSILLLSICCSVQSFAQNNAIVHEGELGISFGSAQYFGDLNNGTILAGQNPCWVCFSGNNLEIMLPCG